MSRIREIAIGACGAVGLLLFIAGVPVVLAVLAGWPLPHGVPSFDGIVDALGRQMTFDEMNRVLAVIGWLLWAQFVWCTVVEIVAWRRNAERAMHVRFAVGSQTLARHLVLAAVMLI